MGPNTRSRRFRYGLILFDSLTINSIFIATAALPSTPVITAVNAFFGLFILFDLAARLWISTNLRKELTRIYTLADLVVVISLVLAPLMAESFAFLRVLRGLRLIHAYHLLHDLRRESAFFRKHEDAILAAVNLLVFIFVITSLVFVLTFEEDAGCRGLCRCTVLYSGDADDNGFWRHHDDHNGWQAAVGVHHGGRGRSCSCNWRGRFSNLQDQAHLPRMWP
jgi:voltage-gated potassium channel